MDIGEVITRDLQLHSFLISVRVKIVVVLFGIIFTISAPMMLVSIVKLQNRRVSDFEQTFSCQNNVEEFLYQGIEFLAVLHGGEPPLGNRGIAIESTRYLPRDCAHGVGIVAVVDGGNESLLEGIGGVERPERGI